MIHAMVNSDLFIYFADRALFSKHLAGSLQCTNQVLLKPEVDEERYIREAERVMV